MRFARLAINELSMSIIRIFLIAFLACVRADQNYNQQQGDDYIKYWTDYQIVAKRCVVYKNVDQIVFQIFTGNDHCTSDIFDAQEIARKM